MAKKAKIPYIDYECKVGERVQWRNMAKEEFEGVIQSWDDVTATVLKDDGTTEMIDC